MPEVTWTLAAHMEELSAQLKAAQSAAQSSAQGMGAFEDALKAVESSVKGLEAALSEQVDTSRKVKKANDEQAASLEDMASRAEMAASKMASEGSRAYNVLIKVGGEYAQMLRDGVKENDAIYKAWLKGLSPAERSAVVMVKMAAATSEATLATKSAALATHNLTEMLEDQARRAEMNVGSQNKLSRSLSELIDQQTRATTAAHIATAAYANQKQRLDAVETAMSALNIPGANLVARGKQLADAFETASERMSAGQQRALEFGLAFGAVATTAIAATAALAAIGTAIVGIVSKADEWNAELSKVGEGLKGVAAVDLGMAAASIDAVGMAAKSVGVAIAETFGPVVKAGAVQLTALGLAATDGWRAMWAGKDVIETISTWVGQKLVGALTFGVKAMMGLAGGVAELGKALHLPGAVEASDAIDHFAAQLQDLEDEQVAGVSAALRMMGRDALEPLTTATEGYLERAEKMVGALAKQKAAAKGAADTIKGQLIPAMRETNDLIETSVPVIESQRQALDDLAASSQGAAYDIESFGDIMDRNAILADSQTKAFEDSVSALSGGVGAAVAFGNALSQALTGMDLATLFEEQGPDAGRALVDGMVMALKDAPEMIASIGDAFVGGLEALADNADLIAQLGVGVVESIVNAMPDIAQAMPEVAVALIEALVPQIPTIVQEIVASGPEIGAAIGVGIAQMILEALGMDRQAAKLGEGFADVQEQNRDWRRNGGPPQGDMEATLAQLNRTLTKQADAMDGLRDGLAWLLGKLGGKHGAKRY